MVIGGIPGHIDKGGQRQALRPLQPGLCCDLGNQPASNALTLPVGGNRQFSDMPILLLRHHRDKPDRLTRGAFRQPFLPPLNKISMLLRIHHRAFGNKSPGRLLMK
ncbi:hypothetical protein D3C78_1592010 [compost metagenome]